MLRLRTIQLPVAALLKQLKENLSNSLLSHFDILYIQQGVPRLPVSERLKLLPDLLRGIRSGQSALTLPDAQLFNILLRIIPNFRLPERGPQNPATLRAEFSISDADAEYLASWFGKLLLLPPSRGSPTGASPSHPGLSVEEFKFLTLHEKPDVWNPEASGGLNLVETKHVVCRWLSSTLFTDEERFIPSLYASADTNSRIADIADDNVKRSQPNISLESKALVERLLSAYLGR